MSILKNKFAKNLFIILLTISLILFGVLIYINHNLNSILTEKINDSFNKSKISDYYNLSYDKLKVNVLSGNLKLFNVKLTHKKDTNIIFFNQYGSIDYSINKLSLKNVNIYEYIKTDSLNVDKIVIKKPVIVVNNGSKILKPYNFLNKKTESSKLLLSLKKLDLQHAILHYNSKKNNITVNDLNINSENIKITSNVYINKLDIKISGVSQISESLENINNISFRNLNININELEVNPKNDTNIYSYSNFIVKINKPKFNTKDSIYTFKTRNIAIDYKNKSIKIENLLFTPNYSKKQFPINFKYQTERYYIDIKAININNIDLYQLFVNPHLYADNITINNVIADIYRDKTYPLNRNNFPLFPAQQIKKINIPIDIKNIKINNANITYSEKLSAKKTGKVDVSNLNIILDNVTNSNDNKLLKISAKGKIRNKIPFKINVNFNYNKPTFTFAGIVYKSNLKNANKIISSFEPVEIKRGTLNKLTFNGYANNTSSKGEMLFLYNNINVKLLTQNNKTSTKVKNGLMSFAANTIIYKNNPVKAKQTARKVNFGYKRDKNKSFINYIWKSFFNGVIETIHPGKENQKKYKSYKKKQRQKKYVRK